MSHATTGAVPPGSDVIRQAVAAVVEATPDPFEGMDR